MNDSETPISNDADGIGSEPYFNSDYQFGLQIDIPGVNGYAQIQMRSPQDYDTLTYPNNQSELDIWTNSLVPPVSVDSDNSQLTFYCYNGCPVYVQDTDNDGQNQGWYEARPDLNPGNNSPRDNAPAIVYQIDLNIENDLGYVLTAPIYANFQSENQQGGLPSVGGDPLVDGGEVQPPQAPEPMQEGGDQQQPDITVEPIGRIAYTLANINENDQAPFISEMFSEQKTYAQLSTHDFDERYSWRSGSNQWDKFITFKNSNNVISNFDAPLELTYTINDPDNPQTNGDKFIQYEGFGRFNGIPGRCVSKTNFNQEVECFSEGEQDSKVFLTAYQIPTGSQLVSTVDGATEYYVKQLDVGQNLVPLASGTDDFDTCNSVVNADNADNYNLPTLSEFWTLPTDEAIPTLDSNVPSVVAGADQE